MGPDRAPVTAAPVTTAALRVSMVRRSTPFMCVYLDFCSTMEWVPYPAPGAVGRGAVGGFRVR
ncbi:hypothetical protein GCM10010343_76520 [Streptomyces avidinii]|nr:hypothetical protein GCM10010343_76520 [Streptomyces avidinii]